MGLKVSWSQFAIYKLKEIKHYYKTTANTRVAKKMIEGIVGTTVHLSQNPFMGQEEILLQGKFNQEFRYLVFRQYKIIYTVNTQGDRIDIVNVFDCRQNPTKMIIETKV